MTKRALLSVHDKNGLVALGRGLCDLGWELVASGGTARALGAAGLPVRDVAELTGAPEMLGGRVKTLHPAIHGGILARDTAADAAELLARDIAPIDLVAVNLYPFAETIARPATGLAAAVEQIDIGGVALLRAAAKNFARVVALCDPADYAPALAALAVGGPDEATRRALAARAFALTRDYDAAIAAYLAAPPAAGPLPPTVHLTLHQTRVLRYGENPHQRAALYAADPAAGPLGGRLVAGKELSYNNLLDLDAALGAAEAIAAPAVTIVKHLSPCGLAQADSVAAALPAAIASDPVSAFGGVIAANRPVGADFVAALAAADLFVEAVIAPAFDDAALAWFAAHKKNCRLVAAAPSSGATVEWRAVRGGLLAQTRDEGDPPGGVWRIASRRAPTAEERAALRFAWSACQHVKSNAIVLARAAGADVATVGIGGGLPSRVDAVRLAVAKAGGRARGAVLASDAFFPFADGLEVAGAAGVTAVVEPGGSVRDDEVIATADRLGLALVFTGARHFRH